MVPPKEARRIQSALETRDAEELFWAEDYLQIYLKHHRTTAERDMWQSVLENVQQTAAAIQTENHALYSDWISQIFYRAEEEGDWRFEDTKITALPDLLAPAFVTKLNEEIKKFASDCSDWQLAMGISYIYRPACSHISFALRDGPAPIRERTKAITSMKKLYSDCFEKRCLPALGHLNEDGNELNQVCYMLWDDMPVRSGNAEICGAVIDLMRYVLTLDNIACVESALHCLGHMTRQRREATALIHEFIKKPGKHGAKLLRYAEAVKTGYIQ